MCMVHKGVCLLLRVKWAEALAGPVGGRGHDEGKQGYKEINKRKTREEDSADLLEGGTHARGKMGCCARMAC